MCREEDQRTVTVRALISAELFMREKEVKKKERDEPDDVRSEPRDKGPEFTSSASAFHLLAYPIRRDACIRMEGMSRLDMTGLRLAGEIGDELVHLWDAEALDEIRNFLVMCEIR